jgi:O-antigen/teichoic acid export membrane protein
VTGGAESARLLLDTNVGWEVDSREDHSNPHEAKRSPAPGYHRPMADAAHGANGRRSHLRALAEFAGVDDAGRVLRDFASYLPTQVLPALTGLLVLPLLARELSPTYLGVVALAQTLVTLGWTLIGGWLATAVIRELPRYAAAGRMDAFRRTLGHAAILLAVGMIAFSAVVAIVGTFSRAVGDHAGWIIAATAGLVIQNTAVSLFAATLRPRAYVTVDITARTGGYALGVAFVFAGLGVNGYLAGLATASLVTGIVGLWLAWPHGAARTAKAHELAPSEDGLAPWLRFGLPAATAGIATWGLAFIDRYLLAGLKDAAAVGVYSIGNLIGDKPIYVPTMAFITAAGPLLVRAYESRGRDEVERLMRSYTRILVLLSLPLIAFLAVAATPLIDVVAGGGAYHAADRVVPIVAVGSFLYALTLVSYTGLIVAKKTMPMVYASFVGLMANVVANLALIPRYGIVGAAIATPIGTGVFLASMQIWARKYARWRVPWPTVGRAGASACVGAAAGWAALSVSHISGVKILASFVACIGVYLVLLELLGERRRARG